MKMKIWKIRCSYVLPVHTAVVLQDFCDTKRPLLDSDFLISTLKLQRPQIQVELLKAEL